MTFEQLRTFIAVARIGSFTHAASQLHLSQPTVSQHVQMLEKSLGQRVFDRRGRQIRLTVAGERLLTYAALVLQETDTMMDDLRALDAPLQGTIQLGAINSVGIYTLPPLLAAFRNQHPSVRVTLQVGTTEPMLERLINGELDLAILDTQLQIGEARAYHAHPFPPEAIVLAVPPDHPWAHRPEIQPEELAGATMIMRQRGTRSRTQLDSDLQVRGVDPDLLQIDLELDNSESIKQAVCAGLGVGFIPRCILERELAWGAIGITTLAGLPMTRQLWLYQSIRPRPDRIHHMAEFLAAAGIVPGMS
jgi:DNA-binding transcriptional LysR family regulator